MAVKPGYEKLNDVLQSALMQASDGKGHERHATGVPFDEQATCWINRQPGMTYACGQAVKKILEACKMIRDGVEDSDKRAVVEYLGAINYLAVEVITVKQKEKNGVTSYLEARDFAFGMLRRSQGNTWRYSDDAD